MKVAAQATRALTDSRIMTDSPLEIIAIPVLNDADQGQERVDQHVDDLDANEGSDHAAESVVEEVPPQQCRGSDWPILDPFEGDRNQQRNDDRVEDHGGEDRRVSAAPGSQTHQVEGFQDLQRLYCDEHGWNNG